MKAVGAVLCLLGIVSVVYSAFIIADWFGFLVKYNDEFNIVEAIKTLWQTPEMRERLASEGKKIAAMFNVEGMYEKTIAILKN